MKILGIDPGLQHTGWGIVEASNGRLHAIDSGRISPSVKLSIPERLAIIFQELTSLITRHGPDAAAVENTFVNANPASALKLGQARGVALLAPAVGGVPVAEYAPNQVKKSIVGAGHAGKEQIQAMVRILLPGLPPDLSPDQADALAIAICHAHHAPARNLAQALAKRTAGG